MRIGIQNPLPLAMLVRPDVSAVDTVGLQSDCPLFAVTSKRSLEMATQFSAQGRIEQAFEHAFTAARVAAVDKRGKCGTEVERVATLYSVQLLFQSRSFEAEGNLNKAITIYKRLAEFHSYFGRLRNTGNLLVMAAVQSRELALRLVSSELGKALNEGANFDISRALFLEASTLYYEAQAAFLKGGYKNCAGGLVKKARDAKKAAEMLTEIENDITLAKINGQRAIARLQRFASLDNYQFEAMVEQFVVSGDRLINAAATLRERSFDSAAREIAKQAEIIISVAKLVIEKNAEVEEECDGHYDYDDAEIAMLGRVEDLLKKARALLL